MKNRLTLHCFCIFTLYKFALVHFGLNNLPNNKLLDWSKLRAFADDNKKKSDSKIEIQIWKSKKNCGIGRKCWLAAFSPFPSMFSKGSFFKVVKSRDCVVKVI